MGKFWKHVILLGQNYTAFFSYNFSWFIKRFDKSGSKISLMFKNTLILHSNLISKTISSKGENINRQERNSDITETLHILFSQFTGAWTFPPIEEYLHERNQTTARRKNSRKCSWCVRNFSQRWVPGAYPPSVLSSVYKWGNFTMTKMIVVALPRPCRWGTSSLPATTGLCKLHDIRAGIWQSSRSHLHRHTRPTKDA